VKKVLNKFIGNVDAEEVLCLGMS